MAKPDDDVIVTYRPKNTGIQFFLVVSGNSTHVSVSLVMILVKDEGGRREGGRAFERNRVEKFCDDVRLL